LAHSCNWLIAALLIDLLEVVHLDAIWTCLLHFRVVLAIVVVVELLGNSYLLCDDIVIFDHFRAIVLRTLAFAAAGETKALEGLHFYQSQDE